MKAVCNRRTCSTSVSENTEGYQEDPPKQVSKCNNCVKSKDPKVYTKKKKLIHLHFSPSIIPFSFCT